MPFAATWMDLESYEVSQTEEEKYHDIPYTWNRERNYTNGLTQKTDLEKKLMVNRGKSRQLHKIHKLEYIGVLLSTMITKYT